MQVKNNVSYSGNVNFGHNNPWADSPYNKREKFIIAGTTALGVAGTLALLAKHQGYSLAPSKMFKDYKKSWYHNAEFCDEKPVITIGLGSSLGGLAGGYIVDKDSENRKAKLREAILQVVNVSLPIIFTVNAAKLGKNFGKKYIEKGSKETLRTKIPKAIGGLTGLFVGVFCANLAANKLNEKLFNRGKGRPVQASDFSAHLDDFVVAAKQISDNKFTKAVSRFIPLALMVAGNEVGNTCTKNVDS